MKGDSDAWCTAQAMRLKSERTFHADNIDYFPIIIYRTKKTLLQRFTIADRQIPFIRIDSMTLNGIIEWYQLLRSLRERTVSIFDYPKDRLCRRVVEVRTQ